MTTSANVTYYTVRLNGAVVGEHSQHMMCKYSFHDLLKYQPEEGHTIQRHWVDENEVWHDYEEVSLKEFLEKYRAMGRRYRDGCTIEECFEGPKTEWGYPDCEAIKASREQVRSSSRKESVT